MGRASGAIALVVATAAGFAACGGSAKGVGTSPDARADADAPSDAEDERSADSGNATTEASASGIDGALDAAGDGDAYEVVAAQGTGALGVYVTIPGGAEIGSIAFVIRGPGGDASIVQTGDVTVANTDTVAFDVEDLVAGSDYTITLQGTSTDGAVTCTASTAFAIAPSTTTQISDPLACYVAVAEAGTVQTPTYSCATVESISAVPDETTVGAAIALSAVATGPDPDAIGYRWSAPSVAFSAPTSANTNFACTAPGIVEVTLLVFEGPEPQGSTCPEATTTVSVTCDDPG